MPDPRPTPSGQRLLDRRGFLARTFDGLGGIAMGALLAEQRLLAADGRDGEARPDPEIDPTRPHAPRRPHFEPRAKNVVVIFCAGALSHVDTFDYKPEFVRREGQPMPGQERLVSFQGENGNLTAPLWPFRPRGQCGKMTSDLLPHIGQLADELCFIHSLTTKTNTHGPGENVMSTGFTLEGFPAMGAWVTYALGSESQDLPAFVAIEDPRGMPQSGPNNWANGFLPAAFQGTPFNTTKPIRYLDRPGEVTAEAEREARAALSGPERGPRRAVPRRPGAGGPHRQLRTGGSDAALGPRGRHGRFRAPARPPALRRRPPRTRPRPRSPATASWPDG